MAEFITISTGDPVHVDFAGFRASVRRRDVGEDGGFSIELLGPEEGARQELLRFDVFRNDPHYHVPASNPKQINMTAQSPEESLGFVLDCFAKRLPELLREASFPELAAQVDPNGMGAVAERVRIATSEAPEPSSTQRVELTPEIRKLLGQ